MATTGVEELVGPILVAVDDVQWLDPATAGALNFVGYRSAALGRANGTRVAVVMVNVDETHVSWTQLAQAASDAYCVG